MDNRRYISKIAFYYTLFLIIFSLTPVSDFSFPIFQLFGIDKLLHFVMYFSLTILWCLASENFYKSNFKLLLFAIFFGFVLEIFQHILPFGRYFDLGDLLANSLGVIFGIIILYYIKKKLL